MELSLHRGPDKTYPKVVTLKMPKLKTYWKTDIIMEEGNWATYIDQDKALTVMDVKRYFNGFDGERYCWKYVKLTAWEVSSLIPLAVSRSLAIALTSYAFPTAYKLPRRTCWVLEVAEDVAQEAWAAPHRSCESTPPSFPLCSDLC